MLFAVFEKVIGQSVMIAIVILAVCFVRGIFCRLPKRYLFMLWGIVGIRLVCPFEIASPVSIFNLTGMPVQERSSEESGQVWENHGSSSYRDRESDETETNSVEEAPAVSFSKKESVPEPYAVSEDSVIHTKETKNVSPFVKYGTFLWLFGMIILLLWNVYGTFRLKGRLKNAVRYRENIFESDVISSPFVMGLIHPRIYIPFRLGEEEKTYVILHEQFHIKRRDYIIKAAAFLLVCVYWFHPLVWLFYLFMNQDMEMSCDEHVLKKMDADIRIAYSRSLLGFAVRRNGSAAGFVSFGETAVRRRVKNVLKFKKYGIWMGAAAVVILLVTAFVCLTGASANGNGTDKLSDGVGKEPAVEQTGAPDKYEMTVAETDINDYRVRVVYVSENPIPDKKELSFGMYEGKFQIQTDNKSGDRCGTYDLQFADKMYFPADGFEISLADYDGDGRKNDFSLGQGQTPEPALGNYMEYRLFGVDEQGNIKKHTLSTEDGESLLCMPGEYSKKFEVKNGKITYVGLGAVGVKKRRAEVIIPTISHF